MIEFTRDERVRRRRSVNVIKNSANLTIFFSQCTIYSQKTPRRPRNYSRITAIALVKINNKILNFIDESWCILTQNKGFDASSVQ